MRSAASGAAPAPSTTVFSISADHLHLGPVGLDGEGDTGDEPTAADGDEHRVHFRPLREQLEPERALPGDDALVVERVDERKPALGLDLAGAPVRLLVVRAVQDDLGAVAAGGRHLDERRPFRHDDDGRDPEAGGVKGDREAVVAGAGRDDATRALVRVELEQKVGGSALLERAGHLEVLELDEAARAGEL